MRLVQQLCLHPGAHCRPARLRLHVETEALQYHCHMPHIDLRWGFWRHRLLGGCWQHVQLPLMMLQQLLLLLLLLQS
jgi:hypothetical protein